MQDDPAPARNHGPLIAASTLLGIGMGGFLDGIVLHQLLQTHNMLSAVHPKTSLVNAEINMFWDGLFHLFTWAMTALGLAMLWGAVRRSDVPLSTRVFGGSLLLGWGIFNLVEGIIDHFLLGIHHFIQRLGLSIYDWAYLGSGVLLILLGWVVIRAGMRDPGEAPARQPRRRRQLAG